MPRNASFKSADSTTDSTLVGKDFTTGDPPARVSETGTDADKRGKVTATCSDPQHTFSPRDPDDAAFASLDEAVDDLVTDVETTTSDPTLIEIPHNSPTGAQLTWAAQVTFGANGNTIPVGKGNFGRRGDYILVSVNNGNPCILMDDVKLTGNAGYHFGNFLVDGQANDAEWIRIRQSSGGTYAYGNYRRFHGASASASGIIVMDSQSANFMIDRVQFNGNGSGGQQEDVSAMRCITIEDSLSTGSPAGELHIHGVGSYADPSFPIDSHYYDAAGGGNTKISNSRFEGAGGRAAIDAPSGAVQVSGSCELGRSETGAHGVYLAGYKGHIANSVLWSGTRDGSAYVSSAIGSGSLTPSPGTVGSHNATNAIEITSPGGTNLVVGPDSNAVLQPVNYSGSGNLATVDVTQI